MVRRAARALTLFGALLLGLMIGGTAMAGPIETVEPGGRPETATLAATGLNVTVPVIIGLSLLVLGTAVVGWVTLHGSRSRQPDQ